MQKGGKVCAFKKKHILSQKLLLCWLEYALELNVLLMSLIFSIFYQVIFLYRNIHYCLFYYFGEIAKKKIDPVYVFSHEWKRLLLVLNNCPWMRRWVKEIYRLRRQRKCEFWPTFEFLKPETGPWTGSNTNCQYGPSITKIVPLQPPCCP